MNIIKFSIILVFITTLVGCKSTGNLTPLQEYQKVQQNLSQGWNTWDTYHIMNHVLLPQKISLDLYLIDSEGNRVEKCQIGDRTKGNPLILPGERTFDGKYTELIVLWNGHKVKVQSSSSNNENIILVTPEVDNKNGLTIAIHPHAIWNSKCDVTVSGNSFRYTSVSDSINFSLEGSVIGDIKTMEGNEIFVSANSPILVTVGNNITIDRARKIFNDRKSELTDFKSKNCGKEYECFDAMQSVLAWDNIYSNELGKVITPVSRIWNSQRGGYVLFCWDAYFASMMLSHCNKELAYANIVEITNAQTPDGFIPNRVQSGNNYTCDRSQPPVGSLALWHIYSRYGDKWLLELLFDKLIVWNRWWHKARSWDGLMCWGSNFCQSEHKQWYQIQSRHAASLESGLDNTHMYDGIDFDKERNLMCLQDVGLTSMYVMDCRKLALIAKEIGRLNEYNELINRAENYCRNIQKFWCEEDGMFYNRDPRNYEFNKRFSPTNLYVFLAKAATKQQAKRIINEHMLNPEELGGDWLLPATPRNDPAFNDNNYWRGRIWAPLNFLVYLGMCNYDLIEETDLLAKNSKALLMSGWQENRYIFENYNSITGQGDDVSNSDKFYHWGALLGYISIITNTK